MTQIKQKLFYLKKITLEKAIESKVNKIFQCENTFFILKKDSPSYKLEREVLSF